MKTPRIEIVWEKSDDPNIWIATYRIVTLTTNQKIGEEMRINYKYKNTNSPIDKLDSPWIDDVYLMVDSLILNLPAYISYGDSFREIIPTKGMI